MIGDIVGGLAASSVSPRRGLPAFGSLAVGVTSADLIAKIFLQPGLERASVGRSRRP